MGVEEWSDEQEVIVKPLLYIVAGQSEIVGAALLDNKKIGLMLDGVSLIKRAKLEHTGGLEKECKNGALSNFGSR